MAESVVRYRIVTTAGNTYFVVGPRSVEITVADENDPRNSEFRTLLETVCKVATLALEMGATHGDVAQMMVEGDLGRHTIVKDLAILIRIFAEENNYSLECHEI